jgi:hypothetical protein
MMDGLQRTISIPSELTNKAMLPAKAPENSLDDPQV